MSRAEFHYAYERMPEDYRAELIGGVVFEPSPLSWSHGSNHINLGFLLETYARSTPGTEVGDNATVFLSAEDEVQPDLVLRTVHARGGQTRLTKDDFVDGAPELVAEVAHSSRAIDLHLKRERFTLTGVREYIVMCLRPKRLYWFDLHRQEELKPDKDGILRSRVFPGLWLHGEALLSRDTKLADKTLKSGLKSEEHAKFVRSLLKRKDSSQTKKRK
ncbi:MAG TPA: Uma2 family endonuclease [Candidatus Obscuribacterales bacterium]